MSSIDSWRRKQQRKKRGALIAVALAAVVAVLVGFMWWNGSSNHKQQGSGVTAMRNHDIGADVTASGQKVPSDIKTTIVKGNVPPLKHTTAATPLYEFTPSGKLAAPLTLRFKLKQPADPKDANFVYATRETNKDPWEYIHATPTSDGRFVEVTVTHFSLGIALHLSIPTPQIVLWNNPKDALGLKEEFKDNLTGSWVAKAEKPVCQNEPKARQDGYHADSEGTGTLYWCFGIENDKRVLKVVNRKHYPLDVDHKGLKVISNGHFLANLNQLARIGTGKDHIILFPGDTAVFSVDLKMNTAGRVKTSYSLKSGEATTLNGLQTALLTVNSLVLKSNAPGAKQLTQQETYKVMNYLLQGKDCYNAVASSNQADLYADCFGAADPKALSEVSPKLGTAGLLASYVKDVGSAASWFREIISGNIDSLNDEANYGIVIRRFQASTEVPKSYYGIWGNDDAEVTIGPKGATQQFLYESYTWAYITTQMESGNCIARVTKSPNPKLPVGSIITLTLLPGHKMTVVSEELGISSTMDLFTRNYWELE